jgi:transposase-like protein
MMNEPEYKDADTLRRLYHAEGMSQREVADELGCSQDTVWRWMTKLGVERERPVADRHPTLGHNAGGYEYFQSSVWDGEKQHNSSVLHHRLLALVDRELDELKGRDVHHPNGIPWDNRPSNIAVIDSEMHGRISAKSRWS